MELMDQQHLPERQKLRELEPYDHNDNVPFRLLPLARTSRRALRDLAAYQDFMEAQIKYLAVAVEFSKAQDRLHDVEFECATERQRRRDEAEIASLERAVKKAEILKQIATLKGGENGKFKDIDKQLSVLLKLQEKTFSQLRQSGLQDGDPTFEMMRFLFQEQAEKLFR